MVEFAVGRAPQELCKAEWSDIDLKVDEWRYTVTKTDTPHLVPLSRQSVEIPERTAPSDRAGALCFSECAHSDRGPVHE